VRIANSRGKTPGRGEIYKGRSPEHFQKEIEEAVCGNSTVLVLGIASNEVKIGENKITKKTKRSLPRLKGH